MPRVERNHYAAPRLAEEQGREALNFGLDLQRTAVVLDQAHARRAEDRRRRRRVFRLSMVTFALEIAAAVSVVGAQLDWWPT